MLLTDSYFYKKLSLKEWSCFYSYLINSYLIESTPAANAFLFPPLKGQAQNVDFVVLILEPKVIR